MRIGYQIKTLSFFFSFLFLLSIDALGQVYNPFLRVIDSLDFVQPKVLQTEKRDYPTYTIRVHDQLGFNRINDAISYAIDKGEKNIRIIIYKGIYQFCDAVVLRQNDYYPDVSITIEGRNAIITSDEMYMAGNVDDYSFTGLETADGLIEVIDTLNKICRIPYECSSYENKHNKFSKVQITQWFRAPVYDVVAIENKGILFKAPDLKWCSFDDRNGYNVNYDYLYLGKSPRFRLYNQTKKRNYKASVFFNIKNSTYKSLIVKGLKFEGNKAGEALIKTTNVNALEVAIKDCSFEFLHGGVADFNCTNNVLFYHNTIRNTDGDEVNFINKCYNVKVQGNIFENCGLAIGNTFCITCWEAEYYIANNVFRDFGYGAIGVGVWHGYNKTWMSKGIIEYNEVSFSPKYLANCHAHMLMDSGAIYAWTQNDEVIIRYNYIHDYEGAGNNRGIFCDDGANNLKIYGNVILNIPNCYTIDSRFEKDQHLGFRNNENNFMAINVIDGPVCFMGSEIENRHVKKGPNYIITGKHVCDFQNKFGGLEMAEDDILIEAGKNLNSIIRKMPTKNKKKLLRTINN